MYHNPSNQPPSSVTMFPVKTVQTNPILRIPPKDRREMDFPCEDASVEYQSWCFIIFPSPSSTLEKCGLKVDKHVKTDAKFTSPHVFLWEKHGGGAKEGSLYDLDHKRSLVSSGYVALGKLGDCEQRRGKQENGIYSASWGHSAAHSRRTPGLEFSPNVRDHSECESLLLDPDRG